MSKMLVTVDSGADLSHKIASDLNIEIIPFHLTLGDISIEDGEILPEDMFSICASENIFPKTSASSPADYENVFNKILENNPESEIIHIGLSSQLTSSFQSALDASENNSRVTCIDSKNISYAYGLIAEKVAKFIEEAPRCSVNHVIEFASDLINRLRLGFIPLDLSYFKAGGRLSNAEYMVTQILNIRPILETIDGKIVVTDKLRGNIKKIVGHFLDSFLSREKLDLDEIIFLFNTIIPDAVKEIADKKAKDFGFKNVRWEQAGCVISAHCGPDAFGCAVLAAAD